MQFPNFFRQATDFDPYPYQTRMALSQRLPVLLVAPTGTGKTEGAILGAWLWRRLHHPDESIRGAMPRRLIYCLPMRTLVEQTHVRVHRWLVNLHLSDRVAVTMLIGGEAADEWHLDPAQERVIIGTQDMLLSRALNRGYAASPFRWPWEFGLLNNDCLWVVDEVQLMANGLPTSTQLQAFRQSVGTFGTSRTLWMSATVRPEWLHTVDFPAPTGGEITTLIADDFASPELTKRRHAPKVLQRLNIPSKGKTYDARQLAGTLLELHQPGSMTLVIVNTVGRAQTLYRELQRLKPAAELVLVHARFRPLDRADKNREVSEPVHPDGPGRIVVATQAIEAGVDISARTLVTELAPWVSLVQRFGRCNRRGEYSEATVYWLELPHKDDKEAAPYHADDLAVALPRLSELEGRSVAPADLPEHQDELPHYAVLRRRDLLGLFDTTADLSGGYLDVSRLVRGTDETDVYIFWRTWDDQRPPTAMPAPARDELCSVPIGDFKAFLSHRNMRSQQTEAVGDADSEIEELAETATEAAQSARAQRRQAWRWNHLFGNWDPVSVREVCPGQTLLLRDSDGGYTTDKGWEIGASEPVAVVSCLPHARPPDAVDDEPTNTEQPRWISLRDHSLHVRDESRRLLVALTALDLPEEIKQAVVTAAHCHDLAKAHPAFQGFLLSRLEPDEQPAPVATAWAKRGSMKRPDFAARPAHFRHEAASGIALLSLDTGLDGWAADLAAYLAAAHHGKVRLSIRSLPKARDQSPDQYWLLGFRVSNNPLDDPVRLANTVPATDLGDGVVTPEILIDMSIAHIGLSASGEPSWLQRSLALLDRLGPFRLAFLEGLVRAADVRASQAEQQDAGDNRE